MAPFPARRHPADPPLGPAAGAAPHRALIAGALLMGLLGGCAQLDQARGASLFEIHCAVCHGSAGRGQNPARPYGSIAPEQEGWIAPALNARGHCYLHSRKQLLSIIRDGSPFPDTPMVGFKAKLTDAHIRAVISYLESLWDENTRRAYDEREKQYEKFSRNPG